MKQLINSIESNSKSCYVTFRYKKTNKAIKANNKDNKTKKTNTI